MSDTTKLPSTRAAAGQIKRDEARIQSELAGTDGGIDPFTAAVRATRMPMIITDPRQPDNPIAFVNDAFCRLTGYAREEILGRNCRFLQGPLTDPADVEGIREAIAAPRPIELDIRNHKKDGTPFWNRLLLAPVHDAGGQLAYYFASQLDVTVERERLAALEGQNAILAAEREANQVRLRTSEATLRLAIEAAEVGTWDLDLTTDVLTWSDRTKAMFGISPDVPCGMADFYAGLHPDDREATSAAFASALDPVRRATYDVEYRTIGKEDGLVRWVAAKGRGLFDEAGHCVRAIGTAIDITARKEAEGRLHFLVGLGAILQAAQTPLDVKTNAAQSLGQHLCADRAGYGEILPGDGVISVERDWSKAGVPSLAGEARVLDAFGPLVITELRQGQTLVVVDCERDARTSDPVYLTTWRSIGARSLVVVPLVRGGELTAALYIHSAVPRAWTSGEVALAEEVATRTWSAHVQARAEETLRSLNATLEERVAERTAELERTYDALRQAQKMEAVGQLTGGIAHDFNNLLTVIRSAAEFLHRRELSEERRQRYVTAISETAERAAKLTGQLLAFARQQPLKPEVFEVGRQVGSVAEMVRSLLGSRIQLDVELPDTLLYAEADIAQFETALVNLSVNARDAMQGEGRLTIKVEPTAFMPAMRRHVEREGAYVAVSVRDTGTGIAPGHLSRIFEPFFTTKDVGKGTGLGLSQVFGFAKQSGGDVDVRSEVGVGTCFTLFLRSSARRPGIDGGEGECGGSSLGHGARVLLVEDNSDVGDFASQMLQDLGYEATWVPEAQSALALLSEDELRFDVVFSDVVMPGMNGIELGHEIHRLYPSLPVVLASGYSAVLAEEGSHGFELLQKPYSVEAISRVLRRVIIRRAT
ncbi:PAS domain S-box protein [Methylorubrum extorquens]